MASSIMTAMDSGVTGMIFWYRTSQPFGRVGNVLCQQPRAGGKLQHFFSADDPRDAVIHELINLPVAPHGALIEGRIEVPNAFVHRRLTFPMWFSER